MRKELVLKYNQPAPMGQEFAFSVREDVDDNSWEKWSLPLGNGCFGACVFGRTDVERIQITENSLCNPYTRTPDPLTRQGGLMSFVDILLKFGHKEYSNYLRELSLNEAVARVSYDCHGVRFSRECFVSYPNRVLGIKLTADKEKALNFRVSLFDAFVREYCHVAGDHCGKYSKVKALSKIGRASCRERVCLSV